MQVRYYCIFSFSDASSVSLSTMAESNTRVVARGYFMSQAENTAFV